MSMLWAWLRLAIWRLVELLGEAAGHTICVPAGPGVVGRGGRP